MHMHARGMMDMYMHVCGCKCRVGMQMDCEDQHKDLDQFISDLNTTLSQLKVCLVPSACVHEYMLTIRFCTGAGNMYWKSNEKRTLSLFFMIKQLSLHVATIISSLHIWTRS